MEQQLVEWKPTEDVWERSQSRFAIKNLWGTTTAFEDALVVQAFTELWRQFFDTVLPWCEADRWDSILCVCIADRGDFDLIPTENLDFRGTLGRVNLRFNELRASLWYDQFPDDTASNLAFQKEQKRFVGALMLAWSMVRNEPAIAQIVESRIIPFRVINTDESEVPPLLEVPSLGDYAAT